MHGKTCVDCGAPLTGHGNPDRCRGCAARERYIQKHGAPLAIDLFCGLGGWTKGLLAEKWRVVGFDIERHRYPARALPDLESRKVMTDGVDFNNPAVGDSRNRSFNYANQCAVRDAPLTGGWMEYPAQLVLQDVLTIHGSQFKDAALIVASPPCQEFAYRAMPWKRGKALIPNPLPSWWSKKEREMDYAERREWYDWKEANPLPPPSTALFDACFRIQREAIEAAGRFIPLVVENVRGAQPWVGRSRWHYGSYHLWGDVPALMPIIHRTTIDPSSTGHNVPGFRFDGSGESFQTASVEQGRKNDGGSWFNIAHNTSSGVGNNPDGRKVPGVDHIKVASVEGRRTDNGKGARFTSRDCGVEAEGIKQRGSGREWFAGDGKISRLTSSKSNARKAASAAIAQIPFPLAQWIARAWKPAL